MPYSLFKKIYLNMKKDIEKENQFRIENEFLAVMLSRVNEILHYLLKHMPNLV